MNDPKQDHFNRSMIIGLDFDGTMVEHRWPEMGPTIPGAVEWIRRCQAEGARVILWTNRSGPTLQAAINYLVKNGIHVWAVNENPEQKAWTDSPKIYCHYLVDDVCWGIPLMHRPGQRSYVDWSKVGPALFKATMSWLPETVR